MRQNNLLNIALVCSIFSMSACGRDNVTQEVATPVADDSAGQELIAEPDSLPVPADVAAVPMDAEVTSSGLASKVLVAGTGAEHPGASSSVEVHYSGWTTDGEMFDSSRMRGETAVFPLNRVIAGWTEGLQLMVVGEQRRFWIPAELAYANSSRPGAPQGMLVFDVELIDIKD